MARRKVADPVTISTWAEADELLGQLAERQREIERIELDLNQKIAEMKNNAKLAVEAHQTIITAGEKQLAVFAQLHEGDFGKARSKALTHGVIGWRQSTTAKLLRSVADTVELLRGIGREDCIRQAAPQVDKQAVRQLADRELEKAQIKLVTKDTFFWEASKTRLPEVAEE